MVAGMVSTPYVHVLSIIKSYSSTVNFDVEGEAG